MAKRWVRQLDADCHAAIAAVVTSGVSHRIRGVCMNSAGLQTFRVKNSDLQTPRTLWELLEVTTVAKRWFRQFDAG